LKLFIYLFKNQKTAVDLRIHIIVTQGYKKRKILLLLPIITGVSLGGTIEG